MIKLRQRNAREKNSQKDAVRQALRLTLQGRPGITWLQHVEDDLRMMVVKR